LQNLLEKLKGDCTQEKDNLTRQLEATRAENEVLQANLEQAVDDLATAKADCAKEKKDLQAKIHTLQLEVVRLIKHTETYSDFIDQLQRENLRDRQESRDKVEKLEAASASDHDQIETLKREAKESNKYVKESREHVAEAKKHTKLYREIQQRIGGDGVNDTPDADMIMDISQKPTEY
jgi:chromosome segregation ATPase